MTDESRKRSGQIVAGIVVLLLGLVLFLDELGSIRFYDLGRLWPLIVVAVGASRLFNSEDREEVRGGLVVLLIGVWLLISSLELAGLDFEHSWPLVLVAIGLASLIAGTARRRVGGAFLMLLGGWMLAIVLNYQGLTWENSWPLMMVIGGIYIVASAFLPRPWHGADRDRKECCP